jgi:hypothetical protein
MRLPWRATLTLCFALPHCAACVAHRPTHVAPDESRPHITWEIRTGGDLGDADLVCGTPQPSQECVLRASAEGHRALVTVHLYLHSAARQSSYLGVMHVPFIQGAEGLKGREVSATVPPGSQPVGVTVSGLVTSKAGAYTFSVAQDTMQDGAATSHRIEQQASVSVK